MPSIIYIYPPPSPVRRIPRSVQMHEIRPAPWGCAKCKKPAKSYSDGAVFCELCKRHVPVHERVDLLRGKQHNTPSPEWVLIPTE